MKKLFAKLKAWFLKLIKENPNNFVAYICGNEALPMPLDEDEEMVLLEEMQQGNQTAKQRLIEHNMRLVVYIAKKFDGCGIELEDLVSVGAIGLIKAISTYTLEKKIKLATYASRCIENEILMQIRKSSKKKKEMSFDEPISVSAGDGDLVLGDVLFQEADSVCKELEDSVEKEILHSCLEKLSHKEREIMELRFGLNGNLEKTQKELADMLGISQSYISRIEKKILVKLKKEMQSVI